MYTSIIFFCFFFLKILVASYRCRGFLQGPGVQVCKRCFRDKCDKSHHVRTQLRYDMDVVSRLGVFARWRRGRRGSRGRKGRKVAQPSGMKAIGCHAKQLLFYFLLCASTSSRSVQHLALYQFTSLCCTKKKSKEKKNVSSWSKRSKRSRRGTEVLLQVGGWKW